MRDVAGADAAPAGVGRRLGVYVHWPYCAAICPYCDFNVRRARGRDPEPLLSAILAELAHWRDRTGPRAIASLYLGGGTPSLLSGGQVARLVEAVDALWGLEAGAEITLEANPTDAEAARFADFAAAGVERLSLGVQALDDAALKALGRFHGAAEARAAAKLARSIFPCLSIDLIHTRPDQTVAAWTAELAEALALEPDHVSPYQLTIEAGTAFERAVARGRLIPPGPDRAADLHEATDAILGAAGFEAYEVSNHAREPAARSRHNQLYWTSQDWVGVGPGAHGRLGVGADRLAARTLLGVDAYVAQVARLGHGLEAIEPLGLAAARDEHWLMGLRLIDGVDVATAPGAPPDPAALARAIDMGLAWHAGGRIGLTPAGRQVADTLIAQLL
jgi:oxygen-independent coproporphyrinogen-3 oxidase